MPLQVDSKWSTTPRLYSLYLNISIVSIKNLKGQHFETTYGCPKSVSCGLIYFPSLRIPSAGSKQHLLWHGRLRRLDSRHSLVSLHRWGKLVLLSCVTLHKLYTSSIYRKAAGNKHWRCVNLSRPLWHQVFQQPLPKARGHVHKRFANGGSSSASRVLTWWYASCLLFIFMDLRISTHISSWSTTPQTCTAASKCCSKWSCQAM